MNILTIAFTSAKRMRKPEPLPQVVDTPAQAFLDGWWGGIFVGIVIGACSMYGLLAGLGRLP